MNELYKHFLLKPGAIIIVLRLFGIFSIVGSICLVGAQPVQSSQDVMLALVLFLLLGGCGVWLVLGTTVLPIIKFQNFINALAAPERESFFPALRYDRQLRVWHTEKYIINDMLVSVRITDIFWVYVHKQVTTFIGIPLIKVSAIRVNTNDCKLVVFKEKKGNIEPFVQFIFSHSGTPLIGYTDANVNAYRQRQIAMKGKKGKK